MSQEGVVDIIGTHPEIPTLFIANVGEAVPIANTLELLGEVIANSGAPFQSIGSGNTITYQLQRATNSASSDATLAGIASFDSAAFSVDANGFVTLSGSSTTEISVDASTPPGTNPVVPLAGVITFTGAQVAAGVVGTNVLRSDSLAAHTVTYQIQRTTATGSSTLAANGVSHFDSASFDVDANGFVTLAGSGQAIDSFQPDSGTNPVVPDTNGLVVMAGSGSTTTVGGTNTLNFQLTGLTNHAVLVGAGTTTITKIAATANTGAVLQNNSGADPSYSTATYPSTTTINQILYSSATNTVTGLATTNRASLSTNATGVPTWLAMTDGQVIIGSTAGAPAAATLSAGTGITITNASNSITISASSSGFTWTDVTGATQTLAAENGYITDRGAGVTYTLPASGSLGDTIKIVGKLGLAVITPNSNQQILIGSTSGTVGATGTATSNNVGDCIQLVCITAGASTVWRAESVVGTWTLA